MAFYFVVDNRLNLHKYTKVHPINPGCFLVVVNMTIESYLYHWLLIAWWRHQMETFSALLAFCAGNSPVRGKFPAQRPVTQSFDIFFDRHLNKHLSKQYRGWDLRRHRAHYDVTVMAWFMQRPCLSDKNDQFRYFCFGICSLGSDLWSHHCFRWWFDVTSQ